MESNADDTSETKAINEIENNIPSGKKKQTKRNTFITNLKTTESRESIDSNNKENLKSLNNTFQTESSSTTVNDIIIESTILDQTKENIEDVNGTKIIYDTDVSMNFTSSEFDIKSESDKQNESTSNDKAAPGKSKVTKRTPRISKRLSSFKVNTESLIAAQNKTNSPKSEQNEENKEEKPEDMEVDEPEVKTTKSKKATAKKEVDKPKAKNSRKTQSTSKLTEEASTEETVNKAKRKERSSSKKSELDVDDDASKQSEEVQAVEEVENKPKRKTKSSTKNLEVEKSEVEFAKPIEEEEIENKPKRKPKVTIKKSELDTTEFDEDFTSAKQLSLTTEEKTDEANKEAVEEQPAKEEKEEKIETSKEDEKPKRKGRASKKSEQTEEKTTKPRNSKRQSKKPEAPIEDKKEEKEVESKNIEQKSPILKNNRKKSATSKLSIKNTSTPVTSIDGIANVEVNNNEPKKAKKLKLSESVSSANESDEETLMSKKIKLKEQEQEPDDKEKIDDNKKVSPKQNAVKRKSSVKKQNSVESTVLQSTRNSLRNAKTSNNVKIMTTGILLSDKDQQLVKNLGGQMVFDAKQCTHLVANKIIKSWKFLSCLNRGIPIVSVRWIEESSRAKMFISTNNYTIEDKKTERQYKFSLDTSIAKAKSSPLLQGLKFLLENEESPELTNENLKTIIECGHGEIVEKIDEKSLDKISYCVIYTDDEKLEKSKIDSEKVVKITIDSFINCILKQNFP